MGDQFFRKCASFLRLQIHYIQKLAKKYQVCHKMGVPDFGEAYIIFTSWKYTIFRSRRKNTRYATKWGINFLESVHQFYILTYTIFISWRKNTRFATKWGYLILVKHTSFLRFHIHYIKKLAKKYQNCHKRGVYNMRERTSLLRLQIRYI